MQVQTISNNFNQQSFTGAIKISDNVAPKIRQQLDKILKDVDISKNPYDLEIKNVQDNKFLSIVSQNPNSPNEKYTVLVRDFLQKFSILNEAVGDAMKNFRKLSSMPKKNFEKTI